MAEEQTPVAETTEETNAPQAPEENTSNDTTNETTAVEAVADDTAVEAPTESDTTTNAVEPESTPAKADSGESKAERVEVEDGRDYELMFIVRITESTDAATDRVRALIEGSGGAVDNVRVSEQRRLQYPIKKEIEGFYVVVNGRFTKEAAAELDRALKLDEAILRHMTIRLDEE